MKNILNKLGKSKFLILGLFIGVTSAMGVKMVMNTSGPRVPVWMFFLPPIIAYVFLKIFKKNKR
ncbi:hypothetical protein G9F72_009190 [Clostridium estertheticum]|uniref:hypothetical protein n=1 Tax=Clostridium estertheticum TaxID=238834 RepID=UPI0013E92D3C|nr:hypothetical protein [Clostridium estertheticum]MBZ9686502.1 hypothetical protein [Clostridium estertheticum]